MKSLLTTLLIAAALFTSSVGSAPAPTPTPAVYPVSATSRDGSHDFDFEHGTWRTHYRLLKDRLVGSHTWSDCYGTSVIRPFWGDKGNLEDGDLKCPTRYIGGMTLRTYDTQTHQWTLWWGTRTIGVGAPAQVGHFDANGKGDFYSYDTWNGKPIICRFEWTTVRGNPHFEQAFSTDHGKSWEVNWTTDYERVSSSAKGVWNVAASASDGHTSFDFLLGKWNIHTRRLAHALANNHTWLDCYGPSNVTQFWGGDANIQEGDLKCPDHEVDGLTVRLYDATAHRWKLYWATLRSGLDPVPHVGRFAANGIGDFFAPDTYEGKAVTVRYRWALRNGLPHFEQAYSPDRGKTWETNWTTDYTRV